MLPSISEDFTITSVDFLNDYINPARKQCGQSEVRYNDFIGRAKEELDITHNETFAMESTGGRTRQAVNLSYDQMMLVGMRESKAVRKVILKKLKELQKPQDNPALTLAHEVIRLAAENERLEKTKAHINDKRTATLMNKASQDAKKIKRLENQLQDQGNYLSLIAAGLPQRIDTEFKMNVQVWRVLKKISQDLQHDIIKVDDPRYGQANTYHVDVIEKFKEDYL